MLIVEKLSNVSEVQIQNSLRLLKMYQTRRSDCNIHIIKIKNIHFALLVEIQISNIRFHITPFTGRRVSLCWQTVDRTDTIESVVALNNCECTCKCANLGSIATVWINRTLFFKLGRKHTYKHNTQGTCFREIGGINTM